MKNKLYDIFDAVTMVFSPLIENVFDYAEIMKARREKRKVRGRAYTASGATVSGNLTMNLFRSRAL